MEKLQCELCSGTEFTKTDEYFVCDFCRTKYSREQAKKMMIEGTVEVAGTIRVDRASEATNFITLAESALAGSNPIQAFAYANRALEIDVNIPQGWACRAKAAGWSSTLQNIRFAEMLNSFNTALEKTPEDKQHQLKIEWAGDLLRICVALHNMSWKHVTQFPGVAGEWQQHINRCTQIFTVLDIAYQWDRSRAILENEITIASNLIKGIKFKNARGQSQVVFLKPEFQQMMQSRIDKASDEMRTFDPTYVTPRPKRNRPGLF